MEPTRLKPLFKIAPEHLRALLQDLIQSAPAFVYQEPLTEEHQRWLGRAASLVESSGDLMDVVAFRSARESLNTYTHDRTKLLAPIYNSYYRAELHSPAAAQGRFIAPDDTWNGYAALVRLFQAPSRTLFVVDPYIDASLFIELLPHAKETGQVFCLTARSGDKAGLLAAYAKWQSDAPAGSPPVELRFAPKGALHDRLVFVNDTELWLVSQSLKDIAKRSPASLVKADDELTAFKREHYGELWNISEPA